MSGFAKLVPAFTAQIPITAASAIGSGKTGGLNQVSFLKEGGGIKSEPGYPIKVDATFVHGSDYIRADPDSKHLRLNVISTLKDAGGENAFLTYNYTGIITLDGSIGKVLGGAPDAKTTEYGNVFSHVNFESGAEHLKELENRVYVGSGRFVLESGKPVVVEYKISEVVL